LRAEQGGHLDLRLGEHHIDDVTELRIDGRGVADEADALATEGAGYEESCRAECHGAYYQASGLRQRYDRGSHVFYCSLESPIGPLLLAADAVGVRFLLFNSGRRPVAPKPEWEPARGQLREAVRQLTAYFKGRLREFDVPVAPEGTSFQCRVWAALQQIPYGETLSYGELARRLGAPNAVRAVGSANGANPISIIIPCHRVIGSNGSLIGYGGGLATKQALLALERGQRTLL
jgi:methylated-DNA-[protein]-cysteine S-methyltransferase